MKKSPKEQKLEEILRSSKLVAGGFMGDDSRSVFEIIEADAAELLRLGFTANQIAVRMQEVTDIAKAMQGNWAAVDNRRITKAEEAKGSLVCPWGHIGKFVKRVTTVRMIETGEQIFWSDLNIHMILQHGFFEGKGSAFRIEPEKIIKLIF